MKVCVYGLWHLGLVTAAGLVTKGHTVIGLDTTEIVDRLTAGELPIQEPGLSDAIADGIKNCTLSFTDNPEFAFKDVDVIWVTFDTPIDNNDNPNVDYIELKIVSIGDSLPDNIRLVISSQVPVGFTTRLLRALRVMSVSQPLKKVYIAYSPENLRLGSALTNFVYPERIVIGINPSEKQAFKPFFSTLSSDLYWMSIESAEMTKHAINTYLSLSICFANEIARLCDRTGASAGDVENGLRSDSRIGFKSYTRSGDAYSGGTLARDVITLTGLILKTNTDAPIITSITKSNKLHKDWIRQKCLVSMDNTLCNKLVLVIGLTYKPGTDTLRRSGALELCEWLHENRALVLAYDPSLTVRPIDLPPYIITDVGVLDSNLNGFSAIILLKDIHTNPDLKKRILTSPAVIIDPNGYLHSDVGINHKYFSVKGHPGV